MPDNAAILPTMLILIPGGLFPCALTLYGWINPVASGAAPVWRDVMVAIHADRPGQPLPQPAGIEQRQVRFAQGAEQPRREYFLKGTGLTPVALAPAGVTVAESAVAAPLTTSRPLTTATPGTVVLISVMV